MSSQSPQPLRRPFVFGLIGGIPFWWRFGPKPKPQTTGKNSRVMNMKNSGLNDPRKQAKAKG